MKIGFVGWRGMVGSVLLRRMQEENDFAGIEETVFFTTSQLGQPAPMDAGTLKDASDISLLKKLDVILTCQGGGVYQGRSFGTAQERLERLLD